MKHLYRTDDKTGLVRYLCDPANLREKHSEELTSLYLKCDCLTCAKAKAKDLLASGRYEELDELFIRFKMGMKDLRV